MTTGKTIPLTRWTFVGKVISLLFNMLSRLVLSFCIFILFMGFSKQEYWSGLRAWLTFIELDKAVVLVWLDWLVFCDYGFSVSALWCPLATPTILLGFLLPWTWGISSRLLQQSAAAAPYLGWRVSPHHHPSWPWKWSSSSRPSCTCAATAPWMWSCSSRPLPLTSGVG